jgi:hypothetical protein
MPADHRVGVGLGQGRACQQPGPAANGAEHVQSLPRSHDASRRDPAHFFGALEFCGERVSIRPGRTAHDAPVKIVTSMTGRVIPWLIVSHRAFDGKEPLILVGHNEEKLRGRSVIGHGFFSHDSKVRSGHAGAPIENG